MRKSQDTDNNNWCKPWLCICWKRTFLHRSLIVKSQQNIIELLTRPDNVVSQPAKERDGRRWIASLLNNLTGNRYRLTLIHRKVWSLFSLVAVSNGMLWQSAGVLSQLNCKIPRKVELPEKDGPKYYGQASIFEPCPSNFTSFKTKAQSIRVRMSPWYEPDVSFCM